MANVRLSDFINVDPEGKPINYWDRPPDIPPKRTTGGVSGTLDIISGKTPSSDAAGGVPLSTSNTQPTNLTTQSFAPPAAPLTTTESAPLETTDITLPTSSQIDLSGYEPDPQISGFYGEKLLSPLAEQTEEQYGQLGDITEAFSEQAGPFNVWDTEEATLQEAIKPGADVAPAQGLLASEYGGKGIADLEGYSDLSASIGNLYGRWGEGGTVDLRGYGGALERLTQAIPGLTPGEYRSEAKRVIRDPEYLAGVGSLREALGNLYGGLGYAGEQATAIGEARKQQEMDIAKQAREWLTAKELEIKEPIAGRVEEATEKERRVAEVLGRFEETGDWKELTDLPENLRDFDPRALNTPAMQKLAVGAKKLKAIWDRYKDIEGVPLMEQFIQRKGREGHRFDPEWEKTHREKWGDEKFETIQGRARERQLDLANSGFAVEHGKRGTRVVSSEEYGQSEFGDIMPLYYKEDWQALDPRGYVGFKQGTDPTIQSMATPEEAQMLDSINSILGLVTSKSWADANPYVASRVTADLDRFLADEERSLNEYKDQLTGEQNMWLEQVHQARKKLKRAKKKDWGTKFLVTGGGGNIYGDVSDEAQDKIKQVMALAMSLPQPYGTKQSGRI